MEFPLNLKLQANRPNVQRPPTPHQPPSIILQAIPHLSITADVLLLLLWAIVSFLSGLHRRSSFIYVRPNNNNKKKRKIKNIDDDDRQK